MAKVAMKKKKKKRKKKSGATHFFKVMLPGYLNELAIPRKFARNMSVERERGATIRDPVGRSWHADVEGKGEDLWFCGEGWMNFVKGLEIGLGFFLVFKYKGSMDFNVKVFDLTACEVEYSHEIWYGKMLEASSPLNKQEESKASKTAEKLFKQFCKSLGPHFCITLKFCNLRSRPYLNIPFRFLTSHKLDRKSRVILIDPKGRSSPVRITIKKRRPIIQCCFGMGWHEFCLRNHLSAGDKCIFEIKSEEADAYIVHVHIIRE